LQKQGYGKGLQEEGYGSRLTGRGYGKRGYRKQKWLQEGVAGRGYRKRVAGAGLQEGVAGRGVTGSKKGCRKGLRERRHSRNPLTQPLFGGVWLSGNFGIYWLEGRVLSWKTIKAL
jgi:hypothetical protein